MTLLETLALAIGGGIVGGAIGAGLMIWLRARVLKATVAETRANKELWKSRIALQAIDAKREG